MGVKVGGKGKKLKKGYGMLEFKKKEGKIFETGVKEERYNIQYDYSLIYIFISINNYEITVTL